jgi:hypothetical protein
VKDDRVSLLPLFENPDTSLDPLNFLDVLPRDSSGRDKPTKDTQPRTNDEGIVGHRQLAQRPAHIDRPARTARTAHGTDKSPLLFQFSSPRSRTQAYTSSYRRREPRREWEHQANPGAYDKNGEVVPMGVFLVRDSVFDWPTTGSWDDRAR